MQTAARIGTLLAGGALLFLSLVYLRLRLREGGRDRALLASAFGFLGFSTLLYLVADLSGYDNRVLNDVGLAAFLLSGFGFLLHRDALIPLRTWTRFLVAAAAAVSLGLIWLVPLPQGLEIETGTQMATLIFQMSVWMLCLAEPAYRSWVASRGRPTVQRARLRSISIGYTAIVLLVLTYTVFYAIDPAIGLSPGMLFFILLPGIPTILLLYLGFLPPPALRAWWRAREEQALIRSAPPLFYAPDRRSLGDQALHWAVRLVGADQGALVLPDGELICHGMDEGAARALLEETGVAPPDATIRPVAAPGTTALVVPLQLDDGTATLVVAAGRFTPRFGREELSALAHYASSLAIAFDHVRLSEIRDGFLTAVSHEFRTPLTSILGIGETLESRDDDLSTGQREDLMERLRANTLRLDRLLSDVLDVERLSRGGLHLQRRRADVSQAIRSLLPSVDALRGRVLDLDVEEAHAEVDVPQFQRAVEHLLVNAVRHTPDGSKIWVRVRNGGDGVLIAVEDDGEGIPVELRHSVFAPFKHGPNPNLHAPGMGIGLAFVARIAEAHGGRAWVDDRPGGGSSFRMLLPRS